MAKPETKIPLLRITAKRAGFRRAGIAHADEPTIHRVADFSKDQLKQLKGEKLLIVEEFEGADPAAKDEEPKAKE